ncbi:MAG: MCP four helix bundle domain-containing protein [Bryobacterales bacterium]|nr:MCP four helix bundle domain-containing protein [Bryobacterales bacterium]
MMARRAKEKPDPKSAGELLPSRSGPMWLGFAGVLLLMSFTAVDSVAWLQGVERSGMEIRSRSRHRDQLLDQLRNDVYLSSTAVRDYLLETGAAEAARQEAELRQLRGSVDQGLAAYARDLPEVEGHVFHDLRQDLESYWGSVGPVLKWSTAERLRKGPGYLKENLGPHRAQVAQLIQQIGDLNTRVTDAAEGQLQAAQRRLRDRLIILSVITLLAGCLVALVSVGSMRRLQRKAEAHHREIEEAHEQLRDLSDRLVRAQEEERRSLSRELHDEVGQTMSAMLVELGRLEAAAPDRAGQRERLAAVRRMAEASIGSIRNLALLLRPSMLDELGLVPALGWQAREVTRRTGLRVKVVAGDIGQDLPDSYRTCIYRVVQEALHNCVKHAKATLVRVEVRQDEGGFTVSVRDDGIGFDTRREKGLGLLGMEERVKRLGGLFSLESGPGRGTVVSIRFPAPMAQGVQTQVDT